ncbi:MAG: PD40 domain-containing protein [Anaerolineae bacterium]|nr:PD40 domain-containing protein [Anaerolineae bacterium]
MMNVQANIPASTGQNAMFLLVGDVSVTNNVQPGDIMYSAMQDITLRTGPDNACGAAPHSMLIVQSPRDYPITIMVNGTEMIVDGTVFLRTQADGTLLVMTSLGEAIVFPYSTARVAVPAGIGVTVNGDQWWTGWRAYQQTEWNEYVVSEGIPTTITRYTIRIPIIIRPSGIGDVEITVQTEEGEPPIVRRERFDFPVVDQESGALGESLDRAPWEAFSVGCALCPELVTYHSNADGDWDIYTLNDAGLSQLDNNVSRGTASRDVQPTYAPDGSWIAYTTDRDQALRGSWELYLATPDGSEQRRVTFNSGADVNPVWGPENLIAFETNRDGNWELYMFDVSGDGTPVRLTNDLANDINPFWAPDGGCDTPDANQRFVFQSDRDGGDWDIFMMEIVDANTQVLTQLTDNDAEDTVPVLARDGQTMAWLQTDDMGVDNLWIMDLGTMEARQLTDTGVDVAGHTFAPDGSFLAYHSSVDGDFDVFAVGVDDGLIKSVTDNANVQDFAPSFRCTPERLIFQSEVVDSSLAPAQFELFETNPLPLTSMAGPADRLTFQADAEEMFPMADPTEEINSKQGKAPAHP